MTDIVITGLCKRYGELVVLDDFSAIFPAGRITCLMGRSGRGKTTLLRILLGLERADGGVIEGLPRRFSAVFQEDRLCPALTAHSDTHRVACLRYDEPGFQIERSKQ